METEQIQLDLKKLNEEFNDELYDYYEAKEGKIIWDDKYNIKDELTDIKKIWSDLLYKKCREVIQSKSNDKKVDENEVKKIYDEQLKKYENSWELTDDNFPLYFLEAFEEETIDSQEKLKQLIDFTKKDLKFKDDFYNYNFMYYIIGLLKFGEESTLTKDAVLSVLALNKKNDLGPGILLSYVKKFNMDCNDCEKLLSYTAKCEFYNDHNKIQGATFGYDMFFAMRLNQIMQSIEIAEEERNYQINTLFDVLYCLFINSKISNQDSKCTYFKVAEKIFVYVDKNMPKFEPLFRKINEHENGRKLLRHLSDHGIKIGLSKEKSDDFKLKIEFSYFGSFNEFVLKQDNNYRCDSTACLTKCHANLVSQFIEKITKEQEDVTESIKEDLLFDDKSLDKILGNTDAKICKSSGDFEQLIKTINSIKPNYVDINVKQLYHLINDKSLESKDVFWILKLDKSNVLTLEDICNYFIDKVGDQETYSCNRIIKIFKAAKDCFRQSDESEIKTFCKLLAYCFTHVDENEAKYIKFEQGIFDWIARNMPKIKFSNEILKSSGLEGVLSKRCIKLRFAEDNIQNNDKNEDEEASDSDSEYENIHKKNNSITVKPNVSYAVALFEDFVEQKLNNINTKWQTLDDVSIACDEFINLFLEEQNTNKTIVHKIIKTNKRNQQQLKKYLKLLKSELIYSFFQKISPNIIKSSDNLKRFFQTIGTVLNNCKRMANDSNFMDVVVNLIANNAVSVYGIIWYLHHFQSKKNKFELNILLKACQKIQKNQKWNLKQVKKFLGYGKINKNETVLEDINRFFGLLIIFVNNADLKYSNDNKNIIGIDNIKSDMTYEKFANEILVYAKDIYFTQEENFNCVDYIDKCENGRELKKILDEEKINTPKLQLDLQKLNNEFSNKFRYHYIYNQQEIIWDDKYNIRNELDKIKEIWKSVLFAECEKVIKSKANNENVNKDEFAKFYNEHFKQHENDWKINYYGADLDFFFKAFKEETIDTSKKVDQLVDFIKNDLKPRNAIGDHLPILTILKLIKSNLEDDLFKILELNQQKNLSPYVLSECVSTFRLNCNSAEKLLSFGKNYELPDPKGRDEVDDFFRLLWCVLNNTGALTARINPVKNLKILQKIFTYINKDMPQFKPFFGKIDNQNKYTWRGEFFERLGQNCIKIYLSEKKFGDGDIKLEIDYFQWFNWFVSEKLKNDNLDRYKEDYDKFVSEFSNEVNQCGGNITEDIKKQLKFDDELINKAISQKNQMKSTDTKNKINEINEKEVNTNRSSSAQNNLQNQPMNSIELITKISYPKLILKIFLYVLVVIAFAVFIFGIIKSFWFLTILSFILCPVFAFIAYKIKHKTTDEKSNQISTGYLNYQPEITGQYKSNELNLMPENDKNITGETDKNDNSFSPDQNQK